MNFRCRAVFIVTLCFIASCATRKPETLQVLRNMVDRDATNETAALFYNLGVVAKKQVMFGHMEDNMNGYSGWTKEAGKSDVFDVAGAYPAVYGFDFGPITSFKNPDFTEEETKKTHDRVIEAYQRHGVITFSWHYGNPVSQGSFYWKDAPFEAVEQILPGGYYNHIFVESLKRIAKFANDAEYDGKLIPIIFRPFHEFDGDWFWWGKTHCTAKQYKQLYQYTVTYLRDELHVRNFLYAWSPDCNFNTLAQYMERYPGTGYVDIVGMDNYNDMHAGSSPDVAAQKLKIVTEFAQKEHKIAALTETGLENLPQNDWYTKMLLKVLKNNNLQLAYAMVWSNRPHSYWTPYKGHPAEADFKEFKNDPRILFGDKLGDMYSIKGP